MGKLLTAKKSRGLWLKVAFEITDARPTARPEIVEVVLAKTGKPMRLRRDMVEFCHGMVLIPMWLADKVLYS
jgi:hypothetical protein